MKSTILAAAVAATLGLGAATAAHAQVYLYPGQQQYYYDAHGRLVTESQYRAERRAIRNQQRANRIAQIEHERRLREAQVLGSHGWPLGLFGLGPTQSALGETPRPVVGPSGALVCPNSHQPQFASGAGPYCQ